MTEAAPHRLLRASAGTGKTYQLVEAYVEQILEHGLRPGEIVAITFTRKAAAELRGRIRARLLDANVAPQILGELSHAPISNFHGLSLQLLRNFGAAAGFGAATEVLGEAGDDVLLFLNACEDAWFGGEPAVSQAVRELAGYLGIDWNLPAALWNAISRAREDGQRIDRRLLGTYAVEPLRTEVHGALLDLRRRLGEALATQTGRGKEKISAFLAASVPAPETSLDAWIAAWQTMGKCLDRRGNLRQVFHECDQELFAERLSQVRAEALCVELTEHLGVLLESAWAAYEASKARRRALDFGDLVERLVAALEGNEALHRDVRQRYRAVLVDEAQDTNRLQRRMVHLLSGFTGPAADIAPAAQLFVVGDWKQSIYTFRGADPESFNLFAEDLRKRGGVESTLSVSRRSTAALVDGINHLGAHLFDAVYESLTPLPDQDETVVDGPAMLWCETHDGVSEPLAAARLIATRIRAGAAPGEFAILLASMTQGPLFARALADLGIPAVLGGGGGLYEQIEIVDLVAMLAWLCDPFDHLSAAIALRSPLVGLSDSGLLALFGKHDRAINLLRRGEWQRGRAPLAADDALLAHLARRLPEWVRQAETDSPAAFVELLDNDLDLRAVYLRLEGGEQRVANINRFFELAARAEATGTSLRGFVRQQLERIRRGHAEPLTPVPAAARRAVTISSVHQSKGLQYPYVILANLDRKGRGDTAALRYHRAHGVVFRPKLGAESLKSARWHEVHRTDSEIADGELRRLLYVAMTRAERQVVFVGPSTDELGRDGFARHLATWRTIAESAGVLAVASAPPAPPPVSVPPAPPLGAVETLWAQANPAPPPTGSHFNLTVTDLAGMPDDAPTFERPRRAPDSGMDPLQRGQVAHAVLAAMERRIAHPSDAAFVAAELQLAGYDATDPTIAPLHEDLVAFLASPLGRLALRLDPLERRHELPFQLNMQVPPHSLTLHGQIDLLYWDNEGPVVVDFKYSRRADADLGPYLTQLEAYALATARLCGVTGPVRTRLVFLRERGGAVDHLVTPAMSEGMYKRLAGWAGSAAGA